MPRSKGNGRVISFVADADVAAFLASLPNRSDYLRRAVLAASGLECPLCRGRGVVSAPAGRLFLDGPGRENPPPAAPGG